MTADVMSDTSPKGDGGEMSGGGRGTAETTTRAPKQGRPNNKGRGRAAGKKGHVPRFPELPPKYR